MIKLSGDTSPCSNWSRTYSLLNEGSKASAFAQTTDGGFIIGTSFKDWVIKTDSNGNIQWQKKYGTPHGEEGINAIKQTSDGGYVIASNTAYLYASNYVIKLDLYGNIQWQKMYIFSAIGERISYDIEELKEGGYIMLVSGSFNKIIWLVRLDADGNPVWIKQFNEVNFDDIYNAYDIYPVSDGGFVIAGTAFLKGRSTSYEIWVAKMDASGNIVWQRTYAYDDSMIGRNIIETNNKGFLVSGRAIGNRLVLIKIDAFGNFQWQKMTEGYEFEPFDILMQATKDGVAIISSQIINGNEKDGFIMKVSADGEIEWSKLYDYQYYDRFYMIIQTNAGGYAVAGYTKELDKYAKVWVMKLDSTGDIDPSCPVVENITLTLSSVTPKLKNSTANASELTWFILHPLLIPQDILANIEEQCLWGYIFFATLHDAKPMVDDSSSPMPNTIIEPD